MAELFGFKFERVKDGSSREQFTEPSSDDGTLETAGGGFYSQLLDTDGRERTEQDLIRRYRDIAQQPECDSAIEDIINEGIVSNEKDQAVAIELDNIGYTKKIKDRIREEFDSVLRLLDFDTKGHDIFRRWYVDGRLYYHKVIDMKNPRRGIQELRYIDPRKIKKVKETRKSNKNTGIPMVEGVQHYYIYSPKGIKAGTSEGIKISPDSITYVPSGLVDANKGHVLSYLHKAIKPVNQLRMIEDAVVIYRIVRAPERRIFYVDVGNLPKVKAEQYLRDVMARYRNKLVYDASTGEIRDDRKHMSMLEDFWLPRREGAKGTEVSTLAGGQNLGEISDVVYFQKKLYKALNVPISRMESEAGFNLGRAAEISRDELKFTKFVARLRKRFTQMFNDILKTQLVLKGVMTIEDWTNIKEHIQYSYLKDGYFAELKNAEILRERISLAEQIGPHVGKYYSVEYIRKNVLRQTDEDIAEIDRQIAAEIKTGIIASPQGENMEADNEDPDDGIQTDDDLPG